MRDETSSQTCRGPVAFFFKLLHPFTLSIRAVWQSSELTLSVHLIPDIFSEFQQYALSFLFLTRIFFFLLQTYCVKKKRKVVCKVDSERKKSIKIVCIYLITLVQHEMLWARSFTVLKSHPMGQIDVCQPDPNKLKVRQKVCLHGTGY